MEPQNKSGVGSIIGTIIIIAIIILGGLYFWGKRIEESKMKQDLISSDSSQTGLEATSSDNLSSIETDLNSNDINGLGAALDAELK